MKDIVIVMPYMGNDGAPRVISALVAEWLQMGRNITIIQTDPNRCKTNYPFSRQVGLINMTASKYELFNGINAFRHLMHGRKLIKILAEYKNAVVLSLFNSTTLICALASPFIQNKLVFSERNDPERCPNTKIHRIARDLVFPIADGFVFQTETAKRHFPKKIQEKGVVIPNPVNPELPAPFDGERKKTIVAAGRLTRQKNFSLLIHAFEKFHNDFPEYTLEIYGRGEDEDMLRALIDESGLTSNAFLMGFADDIYDKMIDCAIYVSSSDYEGISNSMLEALGMGIPTICTDCPVGGAREMITDGENGLLVPVGDEDALYNAMTRIAGDPALSERLSKNAAKIRERLSIHKIAAEWLAVMDCN